MNEQELKAQIDELQKQLNELKTIAKIERKKRRKKWPEDLEGENRFKRATVDALSKIVRDEFLAGKCMESLSDEEYKLYAESFTVLACDMLKLYDVLRPDLPERMKKAMERHGML